MLSLVKSQLPPHVSPSSKMIFTDGSRNHSGIYSPRCSPLSYRLNVNCNNCSEIIAACIAIYFNRRCRQDYILVTDSDLVKLIYDTWLNGRCFETSTGNRKINHYSKKLFEFLNEYGYHCYMVCIKSHTSGKDFITHGNYLADKLAKEIKNLTKPLPKWLQKKI